VGVPGRARGDGFDLRMDWSEPDGEAAEGVNIKNY
jgi:hypothetical protein